MTAAQKFKFGKLAPKIGEGFTVSMARYLPALAAPPSKIDWAGKLPAQLGMMLNDRLGCCTCAAAGHTIQLCTANTASEITISDAAVLKAYEAVSGYDPKTGANDNGAVETDVLNYWRKTGIGGHKIQAHGVVDHTNLVAVKQAIDLFGFVYIGTNVPKAWETGPDVWRVATGAAGEIVGGHAVILVGYDSRYFHLISWGRVYKMTRSAFVKYVDEVHAVITPEWIAAGGLTPSGLNLSALTADLNTLDGAA